MILRILSYNIEIALTYFTIQIQLNMQSTNYSSRYQFIGILHSNVDLNCLNLF